MAAAAGLVLLGPVALVSFGRDRCVQWAAALAYYTLVGLVPLLIALFAVIKGFGLHRELTPFIVRTIGAEVCRVHQQEAEARLTRRRAAPRTPDTARAE